MRNDLIEHLQHEIWTAIGDAVTVFAPGADLMVDAPIWAGLAIRIVPEDVDAPSEGLGYKAAINGFSFRASDAPTLPLKAIIYYSGESFVVAETSELGSDRIIVTVDPGTTTP